MLRSSDVVLRIGPIGGGPPPRGRGAYSLTKGRRGVRGRRYPGSQVAPWPMGLMVLFRSPNFPETKKRRSSISNGGKKNVQRSRPGVLGAEIQRNAGRNTGVNPRPPPLRDGVGPGHEVLDVGGVDRDGPADGGVRLPKSEDRQLVQPRGREGAGGEGVQIHRGGNRIRKGREVSGEKQKMKHSRIWCICFDLAPPCAVGPSVILVPGKKIRSN